MQIPEVDQFVEYLGGSTEVGLIVCGTEAQRLEVIGYLSTQRFATVRSIGSLWHTLDVHRRITIEPSILEQNDRKQLYDLVCQYQTGSIELVDQLTLQTRQTTRDLSEHRLIMILTTDQLNTWQSEYNWLSKLGMTIRLGTKELAHG